MKWHGLCFDKADVADVAAIGGTGVGVFVRAHRVEVLQLARDRATAVRAGGRGLAAAGGLIGALRLAVRAGGIGFALALGLGRLGPGIAGRDRENAGRSEAQRRPRDQHR